MKKKTALDIPGPNNFEDKKPLTQRLLLDLDFNDPVFDNLLNVKDREYVDFNFKVALTFRTDFKRTAAAWNMSSKELMQAGYKVFIDRYGRTPEEAQTKLKAARQKRTDQEIAGNGAQDVSLREQGS